jgi:hypothetical protein
MRPNNMMIIDVQVIRLALPPRNRPVVQALNSARLSTQGIFIDSRQFSLLALGEFTPVRQ